MFEVLQGREPRLRGRAVCWPNPECAHCHRCTAGAALYPGNRGRSGRRAFHPPKLPLAPLQVSPPLPPTQAPLIWGRRKSKWWEKKIKTKLVTEEGKLRNSRMPSKFLFAKLLCACTCICKRSWALRTDLHFLCDFCIELEGAEPQWAEPQMAATPVALRVLY